MKIHRAGSLAPVDQELRERGGERRTQRAGRCGLGEHDAEVATSQQTLGYPSLQRVLERFAVPHARVRVQGCRIRRCRCNDHPLAEVGESLTDHLVPMFVPQYGEQVGPQLTESPRDRRSTTIRLAAIAASMSTSRSGAIVPQ